MTRHLEVLRSGPTSGGPPLATGASQAHWRREELDGKVNKRFHETSGGSTARRPDLAGMPQERRAERVPLGHGGSPAVAAVADPDVRRPKELVDRRFDQAQLDRVWISDITYLRTGEGCLDLCARSSTDARVG